MRLLKSSVHPSIESLDSPSFLRLAARGIVIRGEDILMLYTQRYDDYTLPGGGIDEGENPVEQIKLGHAPLKASKSVHLAIFSDFLGDLFYTEFMFSQGRGSE
ncbi:hypothetical protein OFY17_10025 [Marinomonas sp. C2222]|uniref:Nudix hydrolase domain-containing protein n=1 Tax=Marinomonas sargassi TaxID=2984494 RepID=A0ABT2YTJ6_9GAMM|nr:hypothetical protein [Marinomonas sargassi]MCV2403215.1 hypothetical protein [Marinomonas sargassi]